MTSLYKVYAYQSLVRAYLARHLPHLQHSIRYCRLFPVPDSVFVDFYLNEKEDGALTPSSPTLQSCDYTFGCPYCSFRSSLVTYLDLLHCLDSLSDDYAFVFCTFTIQHSLNDTLPRLIADLQAAYTSITQLRAIRRASLPSFRSFEVRYSFSTGWHPHYHTLYFVRDPDNFVYRWGKNKVFKTGFDAIRSLFDYTGDFYRKKLTLLGYYAHPTHAFVYDVIDRRDLDKLQRYMTKLSSELSLSSNKAAKADKLLLKSHKTKSIDPFDLPRHDFDSPLFADYFTAMSGRSRYRKSRNFYQSLGVQVRSGDSAALLASISADAYPFSFDTEARVRFLSSPYPIQLETLHSLGIDVHLH